jgi:hypothetical protein
VDRVSDGVTAKYVPDEAALSKCRELGALVGERLCAIKTPAAGEKNG